MSTSKSRTWSGRWASTGTCWGWKSRCGLGDSAAFLSAGGYHHHIGLNTWESGGGSPPPPGSTGLYHVALLYPTRVALADALRRLMAAGIPLEGASDHGVSEALYLRDPDDNGVELYWDKPREELAAHRCRRPSDVHTAARSCEACSGDAVPNSGRIPRRVASNCRRMTKQILTRRELARRALAGAAGALLMPCPCFRRLGASC